MKHCPQCDAEVVNVGAWEGLCPRCLMQLGLEGDPTVEIPMEAVHSYTGHESPVAGQLYGPYRIIRQIGEGGMGVVYLAEQEEPIRRRVALKIIKLGMDSKKIVGRFEAERHALALMEHPNIARVLDAGTTAAGRPAVLRDGVCARSSHYAILR